MNNQTTNALGTEPVGKLLLRYGVPGIVSMVVTAIYNIVDQIYIGRWVGYLGNAATNVAFPLTTVALALALACGAGCAARCSLEMGRGNEKKLPAYIGTSITATVVAGVALTALILLFLEPVLYLMGSTDEVLPYAKDYTSIIALGLPFSMISAGLSNVVRTDGSPRFAMFSILFGAVLNVILDPIFIYTFDMGVAGAAIATSFSQFVSAMLVLYHFWKRTRSYKLTRADLRPKMALLGQVVSLGLASFITQMSITVVNVVLNNSLTYYGERSVFGSAVPLAAMGIVLKINAILISCIVGITVGAQPILGYNYGARNFARVRKTFQTEVLWSFVLASVVCVIFVTMPEMVVSIFGDSDAGFNTFAAMALRIYMSAVFCAGVQIPSANYFQAVGKPMKALILTMSRQLLFLTVFILILPLFFGLMGILYAGPAADVLTLIVTSVLIARELRSLSRSEAAAGAGESAPSPMAKESV